MNFINLNNFILNSYLSTNKLFKFKFKLIKIYQNSKYTWTLDAFSLFAHMQN